MWSDVVISNMCAYIKSGHAGVCKQRMCAHVDICVYTHMPIHTCMHTCMHAGIHRERERERESETERERERENYVFAHCPLK